MGRNYKQEIGKKETQYKKTLTSLTSEVQINMKIQFDTQQMGKC